MFEPQAGLRDFCEEKHKTLYRKEYIKNYMKSRRSGICLQDDSKRRVEQAMPKNVNKSMLTAKPLCEGKKTRSRTERRFLCLWCYFAVESQDKLFNHLETRHGDFSHSHWKNETEINIRSFQNKADEAIKEGEGIGFRNPEDGKFYKVPFFK